MSEVTIPVSNELDFTDGLPTAQRRWAMLSYLVGLAMSVLDGNIANTALPSIATQLHASPAASVWVVDAFLLTVAICVVPLSSLVDIIGYKRVYQGGLVIFTLASVGCSLPHSLNTLILARVIQGLGAASIWSVSGAMMRFTYPRALLGRGIGVVGFVIFTSAAAGPTVASAILAVTTWHWLFAVNIPFGLLALSLSERCLAPAKGLRHRWDIWSAVLNAITVTLLIRGIDGIGTGKGRAMVAAQLIGVLIFGTILVVRQGHLRVPMLAIDLFRRPIFALAASASLCTFMAQGLAIVVLPFYFIDVAGYSQVKAGLLLSPWPIAAGIMSHTSGRLADRIPIRVLGTVGMAGMTCGLILLSLAGTHPTVFQIVWRAAIGGAGFGFFGAPNNRAMVASAPKERSGGAGGIGVMSRLLGQAIGVSFVAVIFELTGHGGVTHHGVSVALIFGACCTVISGMISSVPQPHLRPE